MLLPAQAGKRPLFALASFAAASKSWPQEDDSGRKATTQVAAGY